MHTKNKNLYRNLSGSLLILGFNLACQAISDTYLYELYLHNEYYAEPPGFPDKVSISPIITTFNKRLPGGFENRFFAGSIGSLRLTHKHLWVEFIAGAGKESLHLKQGKQHVKKSRSGFDDFLIDGGYNFLLDKKGKAQLLIHGLIGIPTFLELAHDEQILLGTRTLHAGPVIEFAYDFIRSKEADFFCGFITRWLHGFARKDKTTQVFYDPGNVLDVLLLLHYRSYGHHFECGYNPTFITRQLFKSLDQRTKIPAENYTSLYATYSYYNAQRALSLETGFIGSFNSVAQEFTWFGLLGWYF